MFGEGTNIHFVIPEGSYKSIGDAAVLVDHNPSVIEFLRLPSAQGKTIATNTEVTVIPDLRHLETMQFTQFAGARIRYAFNYEAVNKTKF